MHIIDIQVREKIAKVVGGPVIICGNSDYALRFDLDEEWDDKPARTAVFVWVGENGELEHEERAFGGDAVEVPVLKNIDFVSVGIYSGDLCTTTPAKIPCKRSILCQVGTEHEEPPVDLYNQILKLINEKAVAASAKIGTVTTVEWDKPAKVENAGTPHDAVLNFELPKGREATVKVGEVTTVGWDKEAKVENVGDEHNSVLNFELPKGREATVKVGTVTTGAPGSQASVQNVGDEHDAVLNFTIPQGIQGPQGETGNNIDVELRAGLQSGSFEVAKANKAAELALGERIAYTQGAAIPSGVYLVEAEASVNPNDNIRCLESGLIVIGKEAPTYSNKRRYIGPFGEGGTVMYYYLNGGPYLSAYSSNGCWITKIAEYNG